MSWRTVATSRAGSSHIESKRPCEDSCWASEELLPGGASWVCLFAADGAGSAPRGGEGAELAMQCLADALKERLAHEPPALTESFARELVQSVHTRLLEEASSNGCSARDFACTLLGFIGSDQAGLAFQVGDGGIVLQTGAELELALEPMSGEYANMTHFVTDENVMEVLACRSYGRPASRVAVFTDGLQRLALNMASQRPHEPFFRGFFNVLSQVSADREAELEQALVRFLDSPEVCERTDDDKTLILAVRV